MCRLSCAHHLVDPQPILLVPCTQDILAALQHAVDSAGDDMLVTERGGKQHRGRGLSL